jgi:peptidoglycan/LPS O-acetylase OafA/YrhL
VRIKELDALRGLAAFGVLFCHYFNHYDHVFGHVESVPVFFGPGAFGVQLFFILSGFVIFKSLEGKKSIREFFTTRFLRLYPSYWISVLLTFVVVTCLIGLPGREYSVGTASANLLMFQHLFHIPNIDGVYWTLQRELAFYCLIGLSFYYLKNVVYFGVVWVLFGLLTAVMDVPLADVFALRESYLFIIGMILYRVYCDGLKKSHLLCLLCLSLIGFVIENNVLKSAFVSCFTIVFFLLSSGMNIGLRNSKVLLYLGALSYPLYLIHQNVGYSLIYTGYNFGISPFISIPFAMFVSIGLAILINMFSVKLTSKLKWVLNKQS